MHTHDTFNSVILNGGYFWLMFCLKIGTTSGLTTFSALGLVHNKVCTNSVSQNHIPVCTTCPAGFCPGIYYWVSSHCAHMFMNNNSDTYVHKCEVVCTLYCFKCCYLLYVYVLHSGITVPGREMPSSLQRKDLIPFVNGGVLIWRVWCTSTGLWLEDCWLVAYPI